MAAVAPGKFTLTTEVSTVFDASTDGGNADVVIISNDANASNNNAIINVNGLQVGSTPAQYISPGESIPFKRGPQGIDLITAQSETATAVIHVLIARR